MITSVTIGGLEIGFGPYGVGKETLTAMEASPTREAQFVELAGNNPDFNRYQPQKKVIPLLLLLTASHIADRRADFAAVEAASITGGLVPLRWTAEGVTRQYQVTVENLTPDAWFQRAVATLTAPNPTAAVV